MTTVRVFYSVVHIKWMPLMRHHGLLVLVFSLFLVPLIPLLILSYLRCLNDPVSPLPSNYVCAALHRHSCSSVLLL